MMSYDNYLHLLKKMKKKRGWVAPIVMEFYGRPRVFEDTDELIQTAYLNKELSSFKGVNNIILKEILQMLNSMDIDILRVTCRFLYYDIEELSESLRPKLLDIHINPLVRTPNLVLNGLLINSPLTAIARYRCDTFYICRSIKLLDAFSPTKYYTISFCQDKIIAFLRLTKIEFNLDNCVKIFRFICQNRTKIEELVFKFGSIPARDESYDVGAPAPSLYFSLLIHQLDARTIYFYKATVPSWRFSNYLNTSSTMRNTEKVFFTNSFVSLTWKNVHQTIIRVLPKSTTMEWRNHEFHPRKSWSEDDEKLNLLDWLEKRMENTEYVESNGLWEAYIILNSNQPDNKLCRRLWIRWNQYFITLQRMK